MKRITLWAVLTLCIGVQVQAVEGPGVIGARVVDVDGKLHRLGNHSVHGAAAFVFLDTGCPISRRYAPVLREMAAEADQTGVALYGVLSDPLVTAAQARAFRDEHRLGIPVLWDASGDLAHRLAPTIVPEAILVDGDGQLLYRGRIDDRFVSPGKLRGALTSHDLRDAVAAAGEGKIPERRFAQAVGCVFEAWSDQGPEVVTYHRDIAPIFAANCVECHTAGGIGPFALDSYALAKRRGGMSAAVTAERRMPPWPAEIGFGHFRDQRMLSDYQIDLLKRWADSERLEGDTEDALAYSRPESSKWRLGEPDLTVEMPEAFDVPARGKDIYQYFVVPGALAQGAMITGVDFRPGDSSVVHHSIFYVDYGGTARRLDEADPGPGFSVFGGDGLMNAQGAFAMGGWAPGADPYQLPEGLAMEIPPGADFVFEIHYHLSGRATRDRSSVAFYFAKGEVERKIDALYLATRNLRINAGESDYERHLTMTLPADVDVIDISPHMHYLGRSAKVVATLPDGEELPLIHIPDWDFRWQNVYVYRRPVRLPAGTRLDAWYRFDNSEANTANPSSPPKEVRWGLASTDEMCELYVTYVAVDPAKSRKIRRAAWTATRSGSPLR